MNEAQMKLRTKDFAKKEEKISPKSALQNPKSNEGVMAPAHVLIVEDDGIVALDIESRLKNLGYLVPAIVSSGEEAVQKAQENAPDLVLMDIVLKGEMDGIEAAEIIWSRFGTPVIFLTAYADEGRFERAKLTLPFGYILKPFRDRALKITIEMALYTAKLNVERKRVQKELELFHDLINQSNDAIYVIDPESGRFLNVNEKCSNLGYTREELLNMNVVNIESVIPDNFSWKAHVKEVRGKSCVVMEGAHKRKDGSTFPVEINVKIAKHDGEEYMVAAVRDISERKQAEKALRKSEERWRDIVDNAVVGIYQVTDEGKFILVNPSLSKIFGYKSPEELKNSVLNISQLYVRPEDRPPLLREMNVKGFVEGAEAQFRRKDGKNIWIRISARATKDKAKETIYEGFMADVTEHKRMEASLRESEERYRTVMDANPDPVVVYDTEGKVTYFNPAFTRVFGWSLEECLGNIMDVFVPEETWPETRMMIDKVLAGESFSGIESRRYTKKGDSIPVSISGSIYRDQEGNHAGSVVNLRDISEKKKMETQLRQSQKMESIGTLSGGIAHDFNNILFPMIGFAEMALNDVPADSPVRENIIEILHGAERAGDLVKQILTFSRQTDQELRPLKVQFIIKEVLKLIRSSLPSTIGIKEHISNKCGFVLANATQIHQVAMNLMTNAFHALQDTGGRLEVTLKEVELGVDDLKDPSMLPGAYVCLTVSDTGVGMEKIVMDQVFDPYFTTKEKDKGTGLGLSVVHGIVKSCKGDISVYSEPGQGTAFHVYLPAIKPQVETEKPVKIIPDQKGTERILLVDDEEQTVRMEKQMLERLGYQVTARTSSIEALEAFMANPDKFDLVITDMTMPNMTGVRLSQKLLATRPDISIIICTGFSEQIDAEKAKALGLRGFVMKPVLSSELSKKIREVLEQN